MRTLARTLGMVSLLLAVIAIVPALISGWTAYRGDPALSPTDAAWSGAIIAGIAAVLGIVALIVARRPFVALAVIGTLVSVAVFVALFVVTLLLPSLA